MAAAPGCELKCIFFPFFIFPSSCSWVGWITNPGIVEHVFPFFPSFSPFPSSLAVLSPSPLSVSPLFSPGRKGCIGRSETRSPLSLFSTSPSCFRLDENYRVEFLKGLCFVDTRKRGEPREGRVDRGYFDRRNSIASFQRRKLSVEKFLQRIFFSFFFPLFLVSFLVFDEVLTLVDVKASGKILGSGIRNLVYVYLQFESFRASTVDSPVYNERTL